MLRLTVLLCAGLFGAMVMLGNDHGQQRFGLRAENALPPIVIRQAAGDLDQTAVIRSAAPRTGVASMATVQSPRAAPASGMNEAAFTPTAPLMTTAVVTSQTAVPEAAPPSSGRIMYVAAKSLNVRAGPGKDTEILDQLGRDEAVTVVVEAETPDGWALIRLEGDGVEGYVAARLLRE